MFWCRIRNNVYFVGIYLFSLPKTQIAGYSKHIAVVCISTVPFEDTKIQSPQHSEHRKTDQYQGLANCGEIDLDSDVNRPTLIKLRKSNTVPSQYERLP